MKVLVTGGTGSIGSRVVRALVSRNDEVVVLRRKTSSIARIADIQHCLSFMEIETGALAETLRPLEGVDAVVHIATNYGRDGATITDVVMTNVVFALSLLHYAVANNIAVFINTDTFYNTMDPLVAGLAPYALSKRQVVEWGQQVAQNGSTRFVNLRLQHVYGPVDTPSRFLPRVVRECLANVPVLPLTGGEQEWDFVHVDDVVSAYITVLSTIPRLAEGFGSFDIGTGVTTSLREFVEKIHEISNSHTTLAFGEIPYRANEIMYSTADIAPLGKLGWVPTIGVDEGVLRLVAEERRRRARPRQGALDSK